MKSIKCILAALVAVFVITPLNSNQALAQRDSRPHDTGSTATRNQDKREQRRPEPNRTSHQQNADRGQERPSGQRQGPRESRPPSADRERTRQDIEHNRNREYDRDTIRRREEYGDRHRDDQYRRPDSRYESRSGHEYWMRGRQLYRRPDPMYMRMPRYGYDGYACHRYPHTYLRPSIIIFAQIPLIVFGHPLYRDCRYDLRTVINLSGHRAQVLINGYPYMLGNGSNFLFPGESATIRVPSGRPYDLSASVYLDSDWYETELEEGNAYEFVIPPID